MIDNKLTVFMHATVAMMKSSNVSRQNGYVNFMDFVLQHGSHFNLLNSRAEKHGPMKECFSNSQALALFKGRGQYIYCEGYAISLIPVLHAWVVRREDGALIETTWPEVGREYFGIMFDEDYLTDRVLATESYHSLIDDWHNDWPLLSAEPNAWKQRRPPQTTAAGITQTGERLAEGRR